LAFGLIYGIRLLKYRRKFRKQFSPRPVRILRVKKDDVEMSQEDMENYIKYGKL